MHKVVGVVEFLAYTKDGPGSGKHLQVQKEREYEHDVEIILADSFGRTSDRRTQWFDLPGSWQVQP